MGYFIRGAKREGPFTLINIKRLKKQKDLCRAGRENLIQGNIVVTQACTIRDDDDLILPENPKVKAGFEWRAPRTCSRASELVQSGWRGGRKLKKKRFHSQRKRKK